jgi:hypothetical protein
LLSYRKHIYRHRYDSSCLSNTNAQSAAVATTILLLGTRMEPLLSVVSCARAKSSIARCLDGHGTIVGENSESHAASWGWNNKHDQSLSLSAETAAAAGREHDSNNLGHISTTLPLHAARRRSHWCPYQTPLSIRTRVGYSLHPTLARSIVRIDCRFFGGCLRSTSRL